MRKEYFRKKLKTNVRIYESNVNQLVELKVQLS